MQKTDESKPTGMPEVEQTAQKAGVGESAGEPASSPKIDPASEASRRKPAGVALMLILALALGAVSAVVVWIFVFAMGLSYEYLWQELPALLAMPFLPVIICLIGGLVIGLWEKFVWQPPMLLEDSLKIIAKEKRFPYKGLPKTIVSSFLPLAFGGAVGPEAGLVNIIAGLCTWVGDKLKKAGIVSTELAEAGLAATLTALFGAPIAGIVAPLEGRFVASGGEEDEAEDAEPAINSAETSAVDAATTSEELQADSAAPLQDTTPPSLSKRNKILFYLAAVVGGFAIMLTLNHYFGGGLGLPRFERTTWQPGEILWSIPLALLGVVLGYTFFVAQKLTGSLAQRLSKFTLLKTILCGLAIGLIGSFLPYTLFSGEEQMGELIQNYSTMGAWVLVLTGVVKVIICPFCVNMGWRGGNIFPVIFAGVSIGYGIALLTGLDPVFCVTVLATSTSAAVLRRPLIAVAVLLLCFPVADIVFLVIAAFIGGTIPLPKALKPSDRIAQEHA